MTNKTVEIKHCNACVTSVSVFTIIACAYVFLSNDKFVIDRYMTIIIKNFNYETDRHLGIKVIYVYC